MQVLGLGLGLGLAVMVRGPVPVREASSALIPPESRCRHRTRVMQPRTIQQVISSYTFKVSGGVESRHAVE